MHKIIPTAAALALALSLPQVASAQDQGRGHDKDRGHKEKSRHDNGERHAQGNGNRDRGPDRADGRIRNPAPAVREAMRDQMARRSGAEREDRRDDRRASRGNEGRVALSVGDTPVAFFRLEPNRGLIDGCPPGLARRDNGCLPPGQAKKIAQSRYDYLWRSRDTDSRYRYEDGYLYRMDGRGSLLGYLPVLGGALAPGAVWPTQYSYQPVPEYFSSYYRLNDGMDYRYADGALFGLDPRTQQIGQIAALLTGQSWNVGQAMPAGYDVYNVPYQYRDRYVDTAQSQYRYSDGYVYQVDPTTRLVQAAIQLLT